MSEMLDLLLSSFDDLFSAEEQQQEQKLKRVQKIPMTRLEPFQNHPFKISQDKEINRLCWSMKEYGVLFPLMTRSAKEAAHNRMELLTRQMAKAQGMTEERKADCQMEWVGRMNNIRSAAKEIIREELIFA